MTKLAINFKILDFFLLIIFNYLSLRLFVLIVDIRFKTRHESQNQLSIGVDEENEKLGKP